MTMTSPQLLQAGDLGIDFSMARPDHGQMRQAGARYAIRYSAGAGMASSPNTHPKLITPAEFTQLVDDGFDVIANSEWYESRMTEGPEAGKADAQADLDLWRSCGLNKGASIYYSWDAYPDPKLWPEVDAYLAAANKVFGGYYYPDTYAGTPYLRHAFAKGLIRYGWRPNAGTWSNDGLPYQPDTSTPAKRAALIAQAAEATPAAIWQTGNYWFSQSADENLIVRTPIGSHRDATGAPPMPTGDDYPKAGPWAQQWTNATTGTKRRAAGWITAMVNKLNEIGNDVAEIRRLLEQQKQG